MKIGEGFKNPLLLLIERWRDRIRQFIEKQSQPPCSGIFEALVLGEQGNIPEEVKEHFIRTGTAHLLAISGDQFGIVALLSFSLLIWILKRSEILLLTISVKKWAAGLTIPCIILYAFIAGGGISVIRAMIMVITFLVSILFNRERHLLHTLALAAFLILIVSPPSLFDVSFQLSFLAVLSILYLVPRILKRMKGEETLSPPGALMETERPELPEALPPCQRGRHSGNRPLCRPSFQPDLTHWTDHQPLHHPLGGFSDRPSGPDGVPLLLYLCIL